MHFEWLFDIFWNCVNDRASHVIEWLKRDFCLFIANYYITHYFKFIYINAILHHCCLCDVPGNIFWLTLRLTLTERVIVYNYFESMNPLDSWQWINWNHDFRPLGSCIGLESGHWIRHINLTLTYGNWIN
jgi:hypothetical protein